MSSTGTSTQLTGVMVTVLPKWDFITITGYDYAKKCERCFFIVIIIGYSYGYDVRNVKVGFHNFSS
jgi:hypothetical protein